MLKMTRGLWFVTALFLATPVLAENIMFSCITKNNKQIKVLDRGKTLQYSFGSVGKPELVFSNTRAEVLERTPAWNGVGRYITANLILKNGKYLYQIFNATDRLTDEHAQEIGLYVIRNDEIISTIECSQKHKIISKLDAFNDHLK